MSWHILDVVIGRHCCLTKGRTEARNGRLASLALLVQIICHSEERSVSADSTPLQARNQGTEWRNGQSVMAAIRLSVAREMDVAICE